jgi:hypothetical protein
MNTLNAATSMNQDRIYRSSRRDSARFTSQNLLQLISLQGLLNKQNADY